jgi:hypothetical protein
MYPFKRFVHGELVDFYVCTPRALSVAFWKGRSVWSAGCVMGLIDDIPTCKVLIERMVKEAEDTIHYRLSHMLKHNSKL